MPGPHFDAEGWDEKTYAPFCVGDMPSKSLDQRLN